MGVALAPALMQRGFHVRGSTTRSSKLSALSSMGVEPLLFRIEPETESPETQDSFNLDTPAARFFESATLVVNIPPETALGTDYHPGQIAAILTRISQSAYPPRHIVYISSTSVYGAQQGLLDETTVPQPDEGSGQILLTAEAMITEFARAYRLALTIVRSGGLVGPGRHPGLFLAGRKNAANGDGPVNMIHQLDLVESLTSLIADHAPAAGHVEIYNAVSSQHPTRREFYVRAARAIGVEPPTFSTEAGLPASSKKVGSAKLRGLPGLQLRFDDLYTSLGIKSPESLT